LLVRWGVGRRLFKREVKPVCTSLVAKHNFDY
jgi:hypothetical protein